MTQRIRKSVPTAGVSRWWICGWSYVMPDFHTPDHSIIEWVGDTAPVEPTAFAEASQETQGIT